MRAHSKILLSLTILLGAAVAFASPASAAPGATINSIENSGCWLLVDVTFEDPGEYFVNTWDDGNFRETASVVTGFPGQNLVVPVLFRHPILQGAAGLGVYVEDAAGPAATETFASVGDFDFPGSDVVGAECEGYQPPAPQTPVTRPEIVTTTAPVATTTAPTPAPTTAPPTTGGVTTTTVRPTTTVAPTTPTSGQVGSGTGTAPAARPIVGRAGYTG